MGKNANICPLNHLKAVLYRRYITFKRSWKSIIISVSVTLFLSALGIAVYYMMIGIDSIKKDPVTFNSYPHPVNDFVVIGNKDKPLASEIIQKVKDIFIDQTGRDPSFLNFESTSEMQKTLYDLQSNKKLSYSIPFGLDFTKEPAEIIIFSNATTNDEMEYPYRREIYSFVLLGQALWELQYDTSSKTTSSSSIDFNFISMNKNRVSSVFQAMCPTFLIFGLLTFVLIVITTPMSDIRGEVRTYMIQCTLKILPYWLGAFIVDLGIWVIITTIVWALFNLGWIEPFHENLFAFWL